MEGGQLRLLLWRDYLIRKRKFVTLAGILWATGIMIGIYTVRININNQDYPTCQFPARALPSAGVLPFLQSFICSVSNECSDMDMYEEIPSYNNSKLTHMQSKLVPLLNATVLELAGSMPDAVRLLAAVADVADDPTFIDFSKNGLKVKDLFKSVPRVRRYVTSQMKLDDDEAQSLVTSDINIQGVLNGNLNKCTPDTISQILVMENKDHLMTISKKLCDFTKKDIEKMVMDLMPEINFSKYIKMLGNMYAKLSGDDRLSRLGDFMTALLRMMQLQNFLPPELTSLFYGKQSDFSYLDVNLIHKFVDLFEPTFGDTKEFKTIRELANVAVNGIQYLNKIFGNENRTDEGRTEIAVVDSARKVDMSLGTINNVLVNAMNTINTNDDPIDPFTILTKLAAIIHKFLPDNYQHDILFYSTLLSKLMESAQRVIEINMHIEQITYNVTLRNPEAIKALKGLQPAIIGKAFEALVSAERTQILTSKLNVPGQMFCDISKLQSFLLISKVEAESVKSKLCTEAWKNYVADLVKSFGVSDVKNNINEMASLLIQETLGKDTSSQLYSIQKDFEILRNFTSALISMDSEKKSGHDWKKMFGLDDDSELMKVMNDKAHLGKLMLISVHGALAKEIVKQNAILQYKITPILLNANTLVEALNAQLETTNGYISDGLKEFYGDLVMTLVMTALNEEKTFIALSTYSEEILCSGVINAANYLVLPNDVNTKKFLEILCDTSIVIEDGLKNDSIVSKAISKIKNTTYTIVDEVNWTKLINDIQKLYVKLDNNYPYIFEFSTYHMNQTTQENVHEMYDNAKNYWFGIRNLHRGLHLSVNLGFRLLDLIDHGIFNMTSDSWLKTKFVLHNSIGPLTVIDDIVKLVTGLLTNSSNASDLPAITVEALSVIVNNLPQLIIDCVDIMINDQSNIEPIISLMNQSPPWPCSSTSISELVELSPSSLDAVRSLETLLCMKKDLQKEWIEYLNTKKVRIDRNFAWNSTRYDPHLFLKVSSIFNSMINDTNLVKKTLRYIDEDESTDVHIGFKTAWKYAIDFISSTDGKQKFRKFLSKVDTVLDSIDTSSTDASVPLNTLWERYINCTGIDGSNVEGCKSQSRAVWKYTLKILSVIFESIAIDLTTYFTEINEPGHNILQIVGFTKGTGMYMIYDKLPEFVGVLVNSYFDYGFMSQIRRALYTQFWDCDAVVSALVPAPDSLIQIADINRVKPFVCPSFIHWISLPRDDNVLFNIVAKPQYYFYSFPVQNSTSSFESTYSKAIDLSDFLDTVSKLNKSEVTDESQMKNIKERLTKLLDSILNFRLKETDESYKAFSDLNKKQFISNIYLTRVVAIINKLATALTDLSIDEMFLANANIEGEGVKKLSDDLSIIKNIFKRRPMDAIALHYDLITDVLWNDDDNYTLIKAMDAMCNDLKANISRTILVNEKRTKMQICAKNFAVLYAAVQDIAIDQDAKQSLINLVKTLQSGDDSKVTDIFEFLNNRTQLVNSLKHSIKFSYDLGLPIYLQYLQSNLQGYRVLLTFLSGGDWWHELRRLYAGPEASKLFGYSEQGFEIIDDVLNNLDGIRLVRLIRDTNSKESFCSQNITISDYMPDSTAALSEMKQQFCMADKVELLREIPPMLYASQGYEASLKLSKKVDYDALNTDLVNLENNLGLISDGPKEPLRPSWVTEDKLNLLREDVIQLLTKETITKITFGLLYNSVDAGTLFLNNSQCTLCSQMTTWFKQLNLQVFKKQEYDNLLCHIQFMSMEDVHYTLNNDFHWDMFIKELISSRNYTTSELNRSMNEFLRLVQVHLLEDIQTPTTKLTECLARNVSRNEFGNVTLFIQVLAHSAKLLRAETPHLREVEGFRDLPYFKQLYKDIAHKLQVFRPLKDYLKKGVDLKLILNETVADDELMQNLIEADLNLLAARNKVEELDELVRLLTNNWETICADYDCGDIFNLIVEGLNTTKIEVDLPSLQASEFWEFSFISSILRHVEGILSHAARLSGVASGLDVAGVVQGKLAAMMDVLVDILMDSNVDSILYSLDGLITELHPLLKKTSLEEDLRALSSGLRILHQFKNYLVEEVDLRMKVSSYFPNPDVVEAALNNLGINNTNFWSLAAPKIHAGYLQFKPMLAPKDQDIDITDYVCDIDAMSQVLSPGDLDVVSAEEVSAATVEQFCSITEDIAKETGMVLLNNMDFTPITDMLKEHLLTQLYSASSLTPQQGAEVLQRFPRMAAALPALRAPLADLLQEMGSEPLFDNLKDFTSLGNLLTSSEFLANAGNMMCGRPFQAGVSRMLSNIIKSKDQAAAASQAQLDVLPTEFCKSMYKEIVSMDGGKIVWSFVKPLLMGRILYTPPTAPVHAIIQRANSSFASMIRMTSLVHSFSSALPALGGVSDHREGLEALQQLLSRPDMAGLRDQLLGDMDVNVDVDGMFQNVGDLKGMGKLVSRASDLLRCINLDRFAAAPDETALMHEAARLAAVNEFSAGIVFMNEESLRHNLSTVEYKIRMDIENVPTTARMKSYLWIPGPEASFIENMRYFRGFVQIQDMIDKAIIQLSEEEANSEIEGFRRKRETAESSDWAVYTQQTPYPCYRKDFFQTSLYESQALIVGFFFSLLFTVTSAVRFIVADKETGNTMLMSVMGVNLSYHTWSWFLTSMAEMAATQACVTAVLRWGGILPRTDPTIVFTMLLIFGASVLSFCYLMSKLFSSASFAAVCAGFAYLVTFMPFILILSLEAVMGSRLKLLVCLSMSSSICYAFLYVTRLEAAGRGAAWRDVWSSDDDMSIAAAVAMVAFDALLYAAIGWCIDRYCGIRTLRSHIVTSTSQNDKAGVSIVNVSKTYDAGGRRSKVALDNVSMELHKGQITTLLGHNGAGKTTLTSILTGMLRPTSGHVVMRGGGRVGACPQHDVLVECLTPREHVTLYAQLCTALAREKIQEEVDRMLSVLSLGGVAEQQVSRVSGGTRRRVCVALAFVARPALVALDEPTAGVDPAARRDIWDMIVKLKEDRTILLTTHHLDEAEILSDQIVILHKGQIHTTGSPIEIKRSLGSGYRLSLELPAPEQWPSEEKWPEEGQWPAEERTAALVATVRRVVSNASVLDVGPTLEMALPFYDADGANNNFLELCTELEQNQSTLGFVSYSLDCSTLEQVFCDICQKADTPQTQEYSEDKSPVKLDLPSTSGSSSVRSEGALVAGAGARRGARPRQLLALLQARARHLARNTWLLFMLVALPTLFVTIAMGFSMLRPPPDNEVNLLLSEDLYAGSTEFLVSNPSVYSEDVDSTFAKQVMTILQANKKTKIWEEQDSPQCVCTETRQTCDVSAAARARPDLLLLPSARQLNSWLVDSHDIYIEKRYGGFSSALKDGRTALVAWYNNKGHHALPVYVSAANNAVLRARAGPRRRIAAHSHPLKISQEQLSKDTVYQHIADAGVCALVLVAYCAASAGAAVPLVAARRSKEKRLQLLSGVSPALYCGAALLWDLMIIAVNMLLTAGVMLAFGFPVFVERNNLPAICLLIMLFGFACGSLVHVTERLFGSPSLANMLLFCGNAFFGLVGLTVLLILDIISESDATDNARWALHKVFLLFPQFALGDGMLEIAKNTIQAQVLYRFGMDTYKDPLTSDLITIHICYLAVVGTALLLLNLAIEYGCFDTLVARWDNKRFEEEPPCAEPADVTAERRRVAASLAATPERPLSVSTIGNINRGFVHTEGKKNSLQRSVATERDVVQCLGVWKGYRGQRGFAVKDLTLGIAPGQCMALLGENGAGKSTTFSMLAGESRPARGHIYLDGKPRDARGLCRGLISYCPQSDAIDPLLTVRETLQLYCRLRGITDEEDVIERTIEMFDLCKYSDVRSGALSGGNKRKLCTAVAFMGRTPLVLLDEPTSGMDPVSRACVWRGAAAATRARRGVLLSTHALQDARRAAARVALVRHGRLLALAPLHDCLQRFGGGYVVQAACARAAAAWRGVHARALHATLRVMHTRALHFHVPTHTTVDDKVVVTRLSDIFRLMAEMQAANDVEDYTVNQSSLEQMFLSFSEKRPQEDTVDIEPIPHVIDKDSESVTHTIDRDGDMLESVTSL